MTKEQILEDSMAPSKNWVEVGSGNLGRLYIEVLRCEDLPNMDSLTLDVRDATDAFACIVFEDAIVCTGKSCVTGLCDWVAGEHLLTVHDSLSPIRCHRKHELA